jgi:uncharacterized lipoprotein YbaY
MGAWSEGSEGAPVSVIRAHATAILAAILVAACASSSTKVMPPVVNVSIGQQLIDLKKARDDGVD